MKEGPKNETGQKVGIPLPAGAPRFARPTPRPRPAATSRRGGLEPARSAPVAQSAPARESEPELVDLSLELDGLEEKGQALPDIHDRPTIVNPVPVFARPATARSPSPPTTDAPAAPPSAVSSASPVASSPPERPSLSASSPATRRRPPRLPVRPSRPQSTRPSRNGPPPPVPAVSASSHRVTPLGYEMDVPPREMDTATDRPSVADIPESAQLPPLKKASRRLPLMVAALVGCFSLGAWAVTYGVTTTNQPSTSWATAQASERGIDPPLEEQATTSHSDEGSRTRTATPPSANDETASPPGGAPAPSTKDTPRPTEMPAPSERASASVGAQRSSSQSDLPEGVSDAPLAGSDAIPAGLNPAGVQYLTARALRRSLRCNPTGRVTGTVTVSTTFGNDGKVTDVAIEGEPMASAPVSACITTYARSAKIPHFQGAPFTVRHDVTLR